MGAQGLRRASLHQPQEGDAGEEGKATLGWRQRTGTDRGSRWDKTDLDAGGEHALQCRGIETEIAPSFQQADGNVLG